MLDPTVTAARNDSFPRVVGNFRLLAELGRGGMGVVYEAVEVDSGRRVALKVLAAELSLSDEAFERFRREARLAASISDPRCVFVYGAHDVAGSPAIAMEICAGETLQHRISKREAIPIEDAVRWTLEILEGLEAAHAAGVLHRDVKPSNCFITHDGHVKVGDFGLSRALGRDAELTRSGVFLGSPAYASPEQIRGRKVDERSDLYSCGATLYALLTGMPPHTGDNAGEVMARILSEPPVSPRELRADVPAALEKVVLRVMASDPADRYPDHASFRAALHPHTTRVVQPGALGRRFLAYAVDSCGIVPFLYLVGVFVSGRMGVGSADFRVDSVPNQWIEMALPCLYFALGEGLFGRSVGKWIVGQRVVAVESGRKSFARAGARALIFSAPGFIVLVLALRFLDGNQATWTRPWIDPALTSLLLLTMRKRNGYRGVHELLSGTRVVQVLSPFARPRPTALLPERRLESSADLPGAIGPYAIEGAVGGTRDGIVLQARDPALQRSVWLFPRCAESIPLGEDRRGLARATRLRWLDSRSFDGCTFQVFEAPGGTSLLEFTSAQHAISWPLASRCLVSLVDEMTCAPADARACVEQVWLDRSLNLRLLDEPIQGVTSACVSALDLLSATARVLFAVHDGSTMGLPADTPGHAEPALRRLLGIDPPFEDLAQAREAMMRWSEAPATVTRGARAGQIAMAGAVPFLGAVLLALISGFNGAQGVEAEQADDFVEDLRRLESKAEVSEEANALHLDEDGQRARRIFIAHDFDQVSDLDQLEPEERRVVDVALTTHPHPTMEEVAWAVRTLRSEPRGSRVLDKTVWEVRLPVLAEATGVWGALVTLFAFAARGALTLGFFNIILRTRRGPRASRLRCAWRSVLVWLPSAAAFAVAAILRDRQLFLLGYAAFFCGVVLGLGCVAYALWRPTRSAADVIAGTWLVPK